MQVEIKHISINGKLLALIAGAIIVVAGSIFGLFIYQKSHTWQDYNNEKYGYSLSYPGNWILDATNAEKDFDKGKGGELIISNYKNGLAQLNLKNAPADLAVIKVNVYKVSTSTTLGEFVRSKAISLLRDKTNFLIQKAAVSGVDGEQLIYGEPDAENNLASVKTIIKRDANNMFVFTCNYLRQDLSKENRYKVPDAISGAHNAILGSFKFK